MIYKVDGPFVILSTTGKDSVAGRQVTYSAIKSDPNVPDGAWLIIDLRKYEVRLTQAELEARVRALLDALGGKIGTACAVVVGDTSLRMGLSLQMVAGNMNFRIAVFNDQESARNWLQGGK